MPATTTPLRVPLERSRYWRTDEDRDRGHYDGTIVLATDGGRFRHKIGYVSPEGDARQVGGGPLVPGPWAYTFCLSSVIDNHGGTGAERARNIAAGIEHDVVDGQELVIDGLTFVVRYARGFEHLRLELVSA